jgi:multidrug efflux pump subunit AcrA (membrane-fusion protein)
MTQTIEIRLPDELYEQLQRAAELSRQPTETIVAQSLAHSLPPLLEEIPVQYQPDVYPLLAMADTELQKEMERTFPAEQWAEYEELLEQKKSAPLSVEEQARLDSLRRQADALMFRRGYAAILLKRRGYPLPSLQELYHSPQ